MGAYLIKNQKLIIIANNGGGGPGSLNVVLDLKQGDQVYLQNAIWVVNVAAYDKYITSFSGVLIRAAF